MKVVEVKVLVTQLCPTLVIPWTVACQAPLSMEFFKNTGVGSHSFFQGNFLTQRSSMYIEKEIYYKELAHVIMENP